MSLPPPLDRNDRSPSRQGLLWCAALVLLVAAALKFSIEIPHIFWNPDRGAVDLRYYFEWTHAWVEGVNVYLRSDRPEYPPASLAMLYPATGWLDWATTRLIWGLLSGLAIASLILIAVRATAPVGWKHRILVALMVLSNNGVGTALGNGQLILFVLPLVVGAALTARHHAGTAWTDFLVAVLVVMALVKPHLVFPFVWVVLVQPNGLRWRALSLAGVMYVGLTVLGAAWISAPVWMLLAQAVRHGAATAASALDPNFQFLLARAGAPELLLPIPALMLTVLGVWIWRHRTIDIWYQLAVCALIARLYVYHRVYDDVLLLLVEVALWRLIRHSPSSTVRQAATFLLVANIAVLIAPGTVTAMPVWAHATIGLVQGGLWICTLGWLVISRSRTEGLSCPSTVTTAAV